MVDHPAATLAPACLQKYHQATLFQQIGEIDVWPKSPLTNFTDHITFTTW